ncbi:APC family permease [Cryomorphaceae bacterium 1068]|nr:APC family permease [Cryomorphaceae bacterium 1068]
MPKTKDHLIREIGFVGLSSNIINTIIGSGIFVLPAIVAATLGAASILAYVLCIILITLLMLCIAEVGSKIIDTGGPYIYIEKTFGKFAGFLTLWLILLSTISAVGAIANAIVNVIFTLFPIVEGEFVRILLFAIMFGGLGYLNVIGLKKGVAFVKTITILKIVPLLLILLIGFKDVDLTNLVWDSVPSFEQMGSASLVLYFAFTGAGSALSVSGEVRKPQRTIPRAILFSIFIVGVIYVLIQTVAQGVLGDSLPSFTENPLGEVAERIFGPIGLTLIIMGAGVSMFGSLSSNILSIPRVLFAASTDDVIPIKILSRVHRKYATPYIAIITFAGLGFLFASVGGFQELAIVSSAAALVISLATCAAVIKLRRSKMYETNGETFKIPGGYTVPILAIAAVLWFLSNLSANKLLGFGLLIAILTVIYFLINLKTVKSLLEKDSGIENAHTKDGDSNEN